MCHLQPATANKYRLDLPHIRCFLFSFFEFCVFHNKGQLSRQSNLCTIKQPYPSFKSVFQQTSLHSIIMAAQIELVQPSDVPSLTKELTPVISELSALDEERFVLKSPYSERPHLLDLETVSHEAGLLAKALRTLKPIREDYATAPYEESFNWPEVIAEVKRLSQRSGKEFKEISFYIVAFRSKILTQTDYDYLCELDKAAHAEAVASGGFLK